MIPYRAAELLRQVPAHFVDDGCTYAPDRIFGVDLRWACRLHDWMWCTRAHAPGALTDEVRELGDWLLRAWVLESLRGRWLRQVIAWMFWRGVNAGSAYFNTCGPEVGERCRHNLEIQQTEAA